jgi:hypothetical protein
MTARHNRRNEAIVLVHITPSDPYALIEQQNTSTAYSYGGERFSPFRGIDPKDSDSYRALGIECDYVERVPVND